MNDKVMVAGAGKSGIAAAKLLLETGGTVLLYDSNEKLDTEKVLAEFPEKSKITLKLGELEKSDFSGVQICVMSPGIDLETPFVKLLTDNKVQLWSEIELGYQVAKGQLVAVTGTNGKTTTVTLTGQIMKNAFEDAFTVGNIGFPYTEAALKTTEKSVTVLEASSFQLETIIRFHPHVAAITNITPDHLNRHHTMENYIRIKEDITANMTKEDFIVLNYDDEALRAFGKSDACPAVPVFFSSRELLEDGYDIEDGVICRKTKGIISHWMQHIVTLHSLHTRHDIGCGIAFRMSGMKAYSGWIGKHIQCIELRFREIPHICLECFVFFPIFLPFFLNGFMIIHF